MPVDQNDLGIDLGNEVVCLACKVGGGDEDAFSRSLALKGSCELLNLGPPHRCCPAFGLNVDGELVYKKQHESSSVGCHLHIHDLPLKLTLRRVSSHWHFVVVAEAEVFFGLVGDEAGAVSRGGWVLVELEGELALEGRHAQRAVPTPIFASP